jgi:hypothetical protein
MFVVIQEMIIKLSCAYGVIGVFNTYDEAVYLANYKLSTEGVYQNNCGYYYNCFVEEVKSPLTVLPKEYLFILVKSVIYTSGPTRQTLTEWSSTNKADFESVIGVYKTQEEAKEVYEQQNNKDGFFFCIKYFTQGSYDDDILF